MKNPCFGGSLDMEWCSNAKYIHSKQIKFGFRKQLQTAKREWKIVWMWQYWRELWAWHLFALWIFIHILAC